MKLCLLLILDRYVKVIELYKGVGTILNLRCEKGLCSKLVGEL